MAAQFNKYLHRETHWGGAGEHTGVIKHDFELKFEQPDSNGILKTVTTMTQEKIRTSARAPWLIAITLMISAIMLTGCIEISTDGDAGEGTADENQKHTFQVDANPVVDIEGFNGSIEFIAGDDGVVDVEAALRLPNRITYSASQDGNTITVVAKRTGFGFVIGRSPQVTIKVVLPANSTIKARTSNGSLEVDGISGSGDLGTSNGKIVLTEVDGQFEASTSNGTITMSEADGQFNAKTSNGKIEFDGSFTANSINKFSTSNGSIDVVLDGSPDLAIDGRTSNGSISSDIPILATTTEKHRLVGKYGTGSATLELRTSNGSIKLH